MNDTQAKRQTQTNKQTEKQTDRQAAHLIKYGKRKDTLTHEHTDAYVATNAYF